MTAVPSQFEGVRVVAKANVYFDGKVVSHSVFFPDGSKKTLGLIYPGDYSFSTAAPETMEIGAGACRVRLKGEAEWRVYEAGTSFHVAGDSSFEIAVESGIAEYICTYE